jgi:hypothetical protein
VAWRLVGNAPAGTAPPPLDWLGVLLTCAGLGGLTYAAHLVTLSRPPAAQTVAFAVVSAALLAGGVAHLRRAAHPLINLGTLAVPTFRVSQLGMLMYFFVVGSMPFLLPLMFQTQFGWSPVKSGAVTAFVFAGNVGIKPATTPLINRFGFRPFLLASTLGSAVIVAGLAFCTASTPAWLIAALALASGVTRSTGFTVYSTVGLADMPAGLMRDANTLAATTMQLGAGLAIAGATVALRAGGAVTGGGQGAFTVAFCALALVAAGCAAGALRLDPAAGDAARRPRAAAAAPGAPPPAGPRAGHGAADRG